MLTTLHKHKNCRSISLYMFISMKRQQLLSSLLFLNYHSSNRCHQRSLWWRSPHFTTTTTTTTTESGYRLAHFGSGDDMEESSPPLPLVEAPPQDHQLRIVDVDCNLWHKDLLLLALPKPPQASTNVDNADDDIPECFQILQNDDLSTVVAMITPSSTIAEAKEGLKMLKRYNNAKKGTLPNIRLRTTVGVHPYHVPDPARNGRDETGDNEYDHNNNNDTLESTIAQAKRLLDDPTHDDSIAAIGECGLDASDGFPPLTHQIPYLIAQIQLANEYRLPLFVHERRAHETLVDLLEQHVVPDRVPRIIIHCFTGNVMECATYIRRGYYISISGFICRDKDAGSVQQCLEENVIPLDRLMIETDAPYMGFTNCRELFLEKNRAAIQAPFVTSKQRKVYSLKQNYPNPPSSIIMVLQKILHHLNVGRTQRDEALLTVEELAAVTTRNADSFFRLGLSQRANPEYTTR